VNRLRLGLLRHRHLAAAILALALALRVLVPAGYMPAFDHGAVGVRICGSQVARPMPAAMHHGAGHEDKQNHADQPCAFAGLSAPADPPPAAAALPPRPRVRGSRFSLSNAALSSPAKAALVHPFAARPSTPDETRFAPPRSNSFQSRTLS
jgi:hypothetical protein